VRNQRKRCLRGGLRGAWVVVSLTVPILGTNPRVEAEGPAFPFAGCEARFAEAPSDRSSSKCFRDLGGASSGLKKEAIRRLDRLRAAHPDEPWPPYNLAALLWLDSERTPALYTEAARRFAARRDLQGEFLARLGRARWLTEAGQLEEAGEEMARAEDLATEIGDPGPLLEVRIERAGLLLTRGYVQECHDLLERDREVVLSPSESAPKWLTDRHRLDWLYEMGRAKYELGQHDEARDLFQRCLASLGDRRPIFQAGLLHLLATVELAAELPSEEVRRRAESLFRRELDLATRYGDSRAAANAHWGLGKLAEGEAAVSHFTDCIDSVAESQTPDLTSLCLAALAVERVGADPERALELLERALAEVQEVEDPWSKLHVRREKMRVDWVLLPREEAIREAQATLESIEDLLVELAGSQTDRARLRSEWFDSSYWLIGRLLQSFKNGGDESLDVAFRILERVRARTLRETLENETSGTDEVVGLAELSASLREDEALLSYQVGFWKNAFGELEGGSWVLVTTRSGTRVQRLEDWVELEDPIRKLSQLDDLEAMTPLLVRLYRSFLAPALDGLPVGVRRLIVVPDGPLHRLPFGALRPEASPATSVTASYELTLVPSATLWHRWRTEREIAPADEPALVLADPDLTGVGEKPSTPSAPSTPLTQTTRGPKLAPLPYARQEARSVRRHLRGARLWMGAKASERSLKRERALAGYGVLHLAAHAVIDPKHPDRSAVYLASEGDEDGLLTSREAAALDLRDRLVVLAACETASGELLRAEGVLSLARSFFEAGARTVVASWRNLPDEAAAGLFDGFYRHLAAGASVSEALTAAQREQLEAGGAARVWSGVQVLGDGDLVPFPGGVPDPGPPLWLWILGALGLLSLVALVRVIRGRRLGRI